MSRVQLSTINNLVKSASYAVRGAIVTRSMELSQQLKTNPSSLPFKQIISCNIGNPHALEQPSLTYMRDVLSVVLNPNLANKKGIFSDDVLVRAKKYLAAMPDIGAYSESQGISVVREEIARFLEERDGHKASPSDIFVTNGASEGVRLCMQTVIRTPESGFKDGVLTPIPQYPLYSALTTLLQGHLVPYYLDERRGWNCNVEMLNNSLKKANDQGITTRGLVVINPGNPTGQVLDASSIKDIIHWCRDNGILLMADEVYQENIWKKSAKFVSFRKVAKDENAFQGTNPLQLISFHSISKGFLGECGLRGGYFELQGIPDDVKAEIYKLASISLCSNTVGQIATGIMVQPPRAGEASHDLYVKERDTILSSLNRRAQKLSVALNKLQGVSCNDIEGAMYAFPSITLPAKAIETAKSRGMAADAMYCMDLLEQTGIVVVPGSGFGQVEGTYHFRTTILPPEDKIDEVVSRLGAFHTAFLNKYA